MVHMLKVGKDAMFQLLDAMGVDYKGKCLRKVTMEITPNAIVTVTAEYALEGKQIDDVCGVIAKARE